MFHILFVLFVFVLFCSFYRLPVIIYDSVIIFVFHLIPYFTSVFSGVRVVQYLVSCLVHHCLFFWSLCCPFFDWWLLGYLQTFHTSVLEEINPSNVVDPSRYIHLSYSISVYLFSNIQNTACSCILQKEFRFYWVWCKQDFFGQD